MKSKAVVFACLLFVSLVVIASAVSEGNQEQPDKAQGTIAKQNPVEESKQYCHHGCCRYYGHKCVKCCRSVAEAQAAANTNNNNNNNNNAQQEREVEAAARGGWKGGGGGHGGWKGGGGK